MSFIQFENAREKEKIGEDLRKARDELLKRAQKNAERRAEKQTEKVLSGEASWMLPNLEKKIENCNKAEMKQKKREKKKKKKDKRSKVLKEDFNNSSGTEEEIPKKKKKKRKMSTDSSSSSTCSSPNVSQKKESEPLAIRDDWMTSPMLLKTFSKNIKPAKEKQPINVYDPRKNVRELNPHWKNDGTGLPSFRKPRDDFECKDMAIEKYPKSYGGSTGSWKKQKETISSTRKTCSSSSSSASETDEVVKKDAKPELSYPMSSFLTDQQMNELGAKIIKAEILGNNELAEELKKKLESARAMRKQTKSDRKQSFLKEREIDTKNIFEEHILLTTTDNKGFSRPLPYRNEKESDRYGGRRGKQKNNKIETHVSGERVRYFPDDDKYNIKQMFEQEKYTSASDSDAQFAKIAGKLKNLNDDLEDLFADNVRESPVDSLKAGKEEQQAIDKLEKFTKKLDNCDKCVDSMEMKKQLLVSIGKRAYLALPYHEGLQPNHCLIVPIQHVSCSTQLDEDAWKEITDFRKVLTKLFSDQDRDVVFFETARYLHKRPHMVIHCVPAKNIELAPFYFKKAIQESEYEWSTNKQLISLKEKDLRRCIPKGLPYFWVHFGMDSGFAHVIEDQERFPSNFAQEILGGMLHLDAIQWRHPRREQNIITKVKNFADLWKPYDFTD